MAVLEHARVPGDADIDGWWLWPADELGDPAPGAEQALEIAPDAPREQAELMAVEVLAQWIGSDLAKGAGPLDPGGIAGPRES